MKILLTGASGFIGKELVSQEKADYRCVVRRPNQGYSDSIVCDFNDETDWLDALSGCEAVIHLAGLAHNKAPNAGAFYKVNRDSTIKLAQDAVKAGIKRFVFVSTIGVNGTKTTGSPFVVDSEVNPHNDYARSKYEAEQALFEIANESDMEVVVVRPTLVYGPGAEGNFGLLSSLITKLPVLPFGCAQNKRDFISVQNLADLLVCCATHPNAANQVFLAAENETASIREFTTAIADGLDKKVLQLPMPVTLFRLLGKLTGKSAMVEQLFGDLEVDASALTSKLGWRAPLSMAESMANLKENKQ
ncbi:NAD-dependent epimerase/dehydratase family protein [Vibrio maritimus]